jgi:pimeloyl-ACP methyl ester carboxylesterase
MAGSCRNHGDDRYTGSRFMKRLSVLLPILICCLSIICCAASPLSADGLIFIDVNGSKHCILVRGSDPSNPVLLYLHGGPGQSLIPFAHVATSTLTDSFTVVYWDQRGAGLSYSAATPAKTINLAQLIDDTISVTDYLRNRFGQDKIFLVGHSWGSTLGTLAVLKCPSKYAAYVGVGQVVSQSSLNKGRRGRLRTEVSRIELQEIASEMPIPVFYFLGRYDYCTPTAAVISYFEKLQAPHKEVVWFESSGHRMDVEEPEKF